MSNKNIQTIGQELQKLITASTSHSGTVSKTRDFIFETELFTVNRFLNDILEITEKEVYSKDNSFFRTALALRLHDATSRITNLQQSLFNSMQPLEDTKSLLNTTELFYKALACFHNPVKEPEVPASNYASPLNDDSLDRIGDKPFLEFYLSIPTESRLRAWEISSLEMRESKTHIVKSLQHVVQNKCIPKGSKLKKSEALWTGSHVKFLMDVLFDGNDFIDVTTVGELKDAFTLIENSRRGFIDLGYRVFEKFTAEGLRFLAFEFIKVFKYLEIGPKIHSLNVARKGHLIYILTQLAEVLNEARKEKEIWITGTERNDWNDMCNALHTLVVTN